MLQRSIDSLRKFHPDLPVHVERIVEGTLLDKASMMEWTPFESTLFLDADTVVMNPLDFAFAKGEQFGLACCICECPWANRYLCFPKHGVEYNTGVMAFTNTTKSVFEAWESLAHEVDSSIRFIAGGVEKLMAFNDQGPFAMAIDQTGFNPFILPMQYNFRPAWQKTLFGPMFVWHSYNDVPNRVRAFSDQQVLPGAIYQCAEMKF